MIIVCYIGYLANLSRRRNKMKIEDYCAIKAYAEYEKNFLAHNQNNLPEFEKLNFQKRDDFISQFAPDLHQKLTTFLKYFPEEDRNTVRKSLTEILKANFDNLQENNILDSSGAINAEVIKIRLDEGVKKSLPEIYQKAQEFQQVSTQNITQNEIANPLKENVDFSNPVETKKYFDDFYKNFANCKTRDEKLKYIENGFGISLKDMSEQQQNEVISKCEVRGKIREIKENLRAEFQEANPHLQGEELEQALENTAIKQYSIENNKDFETEKNNNDMMIQLEENLRDIERLKQDLLNCHDENEKVEINAELDKLKKSQKLLIEALALTKDDVEKINENFKIQDKDIEVSKSKTYVKKEQENDVLSNLFTTSENELDDNLSDLFDTGIDESEEDLSDLFTAENLPEIEENLDDAQPTSQDKPAFVNPILTNIKESDLKQEDYTIEIDQNESLWEKLKNGFSKLRNAIVEKLGLNKVKLLNRQKYLNNAENNTKTDVSVENSFNNYIVVSDEVKNNTVIAGQQTNLKNKSVKRSNEIEINEGESINM